MIRAVIHTMHRTRLAGLALATLTVALPLLAGCAGAGGGSAVAPTADAPAAANLSVPPCSLVPDGELSGLGLTGPGKATGQPAPSCRWDTAGTGGGTTGFSYSIPTTLIVAAQPGAYDAGLAQLRAQGSTLTEEALDGRRAAVSETEGTCMAVVDAGSGALSVVASAPTDPCGAARRILETALRTAGA
ncbi:hypothetical protein Ae406Ps2_2552c [Pseudonocardia sp. Ae406_Ps2]|nr:hypothetical protein Ae331Ps2_3367 [Pseudonocardia sp. Ae331_Ps2]OLM02552.1 hypothetical protein Ae406Ps2_2552c [Pseudonocardia sp. Ae406_Ps2]OLM29937.1 hypothetical protein Ae717Ps2_0830 [Pseudonocardia sp. Ae717_Ps2]